MTTPDTCTKCKSRKEKLDYIKREVKKIWCEPAGKIGVFSVAYTFVSMFVLILIIIIAIIYFLIGILL